MQRLDSFEKRPFYETVSAIARKGHQHPKISAINLSHESKFVNSQSLTSKTNSNSAYVGFQFHCSPTPNNWLGDVAPHLLGSELADRFQAAKRAAQLREIAEKKIPLGLEYQKGWPTRLPTMDEAKRLAEVRHTVAGLVGVEAGYLDPVAILERYDELLRARIDATPAVPVHLAFDSGQANSWGQQAAFGF